MLVGLHVKNLALIEETEVNFGEGLNILSGETGAGKSIIIGSINMALGAKADKDMIRTGADHALVELVFQVTDEKLREQIRSMDLPMEEDGVIIIQRRIQPSRSIYRICGETVTAKQLHALSELLIDIHGQHEHQSLLYKKNHLEILDSFAGNALLEIKDKIREKYAQYQKLSREIDSLSADEGMNAKELSLAEFEYNEIEQARLLPGEDDELEALFKTMSNSRQLVEAASKSYQLTAGGSPSAADTLGRALRELRAVEEYDDNMKRLADELENIDGLLSDFNREISQYMDSMEFDGQTFEQTQERLNTLNHLKLKYGKSIDSVLGYKAELEAKIDRLKNADSYRQDMERELEKLKKELTELCRSASLVRKKEAEVLSEEMIRALTDLNFLQVKFEIQVRERADIGADGFDDVEFMISTNPGEEIKSLGSVASGGELSRIMLAIKTVLASRDRIPTMIFDEIDTGISGKTAWRVSEKLGQLSGSHQVICITHLPQIAAMADHSFKIAKSASESRTVTQIYPIEGEEVTDELARMLGGDELTDAVRENARELVGLAKDKKASFARAE